MKIIRQSKLYYREGYSDKIYEIDLCELATNAYIVNFRYGRRGSLLKEGSKTPEAVPREKAEQIFSSLEREKLAKGYQTATEEFIVLPSLDKFKPDTVQWVILRRLQDAIEGKNSFKTQWKTSRVIWKAATLQMQEAIPFILKLTTKGDTMQTYSALWALTQLKASQAEALFKSFAFQEKQKPHIKNMAFEGLLTFVQGDNLKPIIEKLTAKLPPQIRYDIEADNLQTLKTDLEVYSQKDDLVFFTILYLLSKVQTKLQPILLDYIKENWSIRPPYFKQIRAIYKLAQTRNDVEFIAMFSYLFEKELPIFKRKKSLNTKLSQYIPHLQETLTVSEELKRPDSRLAFSQFTKAYLQDNSILFLKNKAACGPKEYLKLAVATLLQYKESDYTPAKKSLLNHYGQYDFKKKLYRFTLLDYPECADLLLLTAILFGNDPKRLLQPNRQFITGRQTINSKKYYLSEDNITNEIKKIQTQEQADYNEKLPSFQQLSTTNAGFLQSTVNTLKRIFGKKTTENYQRKEKNDRNKSLKSEEIPHLEAKQEKARLELFPEFWDEIPEAFIQLLMQAQMSLIHQFAYNNLKQRADFDSLCMRFDKKAIIYLIQSKFQTQILFGFDILQKRTDEFSSNPAFIGQIMKSNSRQVCEWAQTLIDNNPALYMNDIDFMIELIFNISKFNIQWIDNLFEKTPFTDERLKVLLGKVIVQLSHLECSIKNDSDLSNACAISKIAIERITRLAARQMELLSWDIIQQLLESKLNTCFLFANHIIIQKSQRMPIIDIPFSLIEMSLENDCNEARENSVQLLNCYPDSFLVDHIDLLLTHVDSQYPEIQEAILKLIRKLLIAHPCIGNPSVRHLIYTLIRKETFEGSHKIINSFVRNELKPFWNTGLNTKDITKAIHAPCHETQLTAYEILKNYSRPNDFSIRQIISFGNHETLAIRQWCWNYFRQNVARIRYEQEKSLNLLDSGWDDTREYAFFFFKTEFTENDWDTETLISIVDSVRPDVENFGKELLMRYFKPENALEYLTKLSEHPSVNIQLLCTNYLSLYAANKIDRLTGLEFYFRSVLTRVNKARIAKDRIYHFLHEEALKTPEAAEWIVSILDDISAQSTIQDKETCISILTDIKRCYPHLDMHLIIKN
jgi:hypothetical protein